MIQRSVGKHQKKGQYQEASEDRTSNEADQNEGDAVDENVFAVVIEPLSKLGVACLKLIDAGDDALLVGAFGRELCGEKDLGLYVGIRPTGFPVQDPVDFPRAMDALRPQFVLDCSKDLCWSTPFLRKALSLRSSVVLVGMPDDLSRREHCLLRELEEVAAESKSEIVCCTTAEEAILFLRDMGLGAHLG